MKLMFNLLTISLAASACNIEYPLLVTALSSDVYEQAITFTEGGTVADQTIKIDSRRKSFIHFPKLSDCLILKREVLHEIDPRILVYHILSSPKDTQVEKKIDVVFAVKGSSTLNDFWTDFKFAFGSAPKEYLKTATDLIGHHISKYIRQYTSINSNDWPVFLTRRNLKLSHLGKVKLEFSIVGHSLGAVLSQILGFYFGMKSYSVESFGLSHAAKSILEHDLISIHRDLLKYFLPRNEHHSPKHSHHSNLKPKNPLQRRFINEKSNVEKVTLPVPLGKDARDLRYYLNNYAFEYFSMPTVFNLFFARNESKKFIIPTKHDRDCSKYSHFRSFSFGFDSYLSTSWIENHSLSPMIEALMDHPSNYFISRTLKPLEVLSDSHFKHHRDSLFECYKKIEGVTNAAKTQFNIYLRNELERMDRKIRKDTEKNLGAMHENRKNSDTDEQIGNIKAKMFSKGLHIAQPSKQ